MNIRYIKNKRAQGGGIGTLIVFIAIVLVAAIAAYVLLGTAGTLQSRSLLVGKESTTRVSTQLQVESIYGEANDTTVGTAHGIETLIAIVKISPGSDPIDMERLQLHFSTEDKLISRIDLNKDLTNDSYNNIPDYRYIEMNGNNDSLLESGESFEIHFVVEDETSQYPIPENVAFSYTFRPSEGTEVTIEAKIPGMLTKKYTRLYP